MSDSKFKVLFYSDGSHQAFSAAVYTATLLKNIPDMHLTILQMDECEEIPPQTEYSWKELRFRFKRYYWGNSNGTQYSWIDTWPTRPTSDWMRGVFSEADLEARSLYDQILRKTNEIFTKPGLDIHTQKLCTENSVSESPEISDTVNMILQYAEENSFDLIIMGTRGLSSLQGLINGSIAHTMLNKSNIPVLLIKKLPQEFIDKYLSEQDYDKNSQFTILHYADGSQHSFSAAVYATYLLERLPNVQLTVVREEESNRSSAANGDKWREYWPVSSSTSWMKKILDGSNPTASEQYDKIIAKINEIIAKNETRIHYDILHNTSTISAKVDSLIRYASDRSFDMMIMGTRGVTTFKGLILGSLAHNMISKPTIPVLMIKKLPQEFIDNYCD